MAAADLAVRPRSRRTVFLTGAVLFSIVPLVAVVLLAPPASAKAGPALLFLLFVGSSMHVASTAWFYTVREVRHHMSEHRARYVLTPLALTAGSIVVAELVSERVLQWLLLAFFAWQFFHFQKQNLGVCALTARARGLRGLSRYERAALVTTGIGGVAGLLGHPDLLQLGSPGRAEVVFVAGLVALVVGAGVGLVAARDRRDPIFLAVFVTGLLFFLPVWLFASPYAAVAGLTVAHGLQYLLLMALVAAGSARDAPISLAVLVNVALILGLALNLMSHGHGGSVLARALYGVFLGLSMAHFVVDAGLWRLRDEFPRAFLSERLPYLLATAPPRVPS